MKKHFGELSMGWAKVIVLSVVAAIYTAVINLIPFFKDTSFQDIAVNPEAWILFAMLIIMNCETRKEAILKTFSFFLISQPLIYLIEALFGPVGFGVFRYYGYWFIVTLLTIPGAAIAFQVKKKGWLGALALSVATAFLGFMAVTYFRALRWYFPRHLLSMIFCIALAVTMTVLFVDNRKQRLAVFAVLIASMIISLYVTRPMLTYDIALPEDGWSYVVEDDSIVKVEKTGSEGFRIKASHAGYTTVTFTNENGETKEYGITVSAGGIYLEEF